MANNHYDPKKIRVGDKLTIPEVRLGPDKVSIGTIDYKVAPQRTANVEKVFRRKVKGRWERIFQFADGFKLIITTRKQLPKQAGIYGVLSIREDKQSWLQWPDSDDQEILSTESLCEDIHRSWTRCFKFNQESVEGEHVLPGLRPPQLGGVHAIGAHWSVSCDPATIIMPTGTGKTETMLAAMVAFRPKRILVIVPWTNLRDQTAEKFLNLGLLRHLETIDVGTRNPVVGVIKRRPKSVEDLEFIKRCNVVVTNISTIGQGPAVEYLTDLASFFDCLIIDEAHHIAAPTWNELKNHFSGKKILQFTATPFRRDSKAIDGRVIFNYHLSAAQNDGYFKQIKFFPILGIDEISGDELITKEAVRILDQDLAEGLDHIVMARCSSIRRAESVLKLYEKFAKSHQPVMITSKTRNIDAGLALAKLRNRTSRILVCVDMFGEGFDFPNLKIAALHDPHKSLAITLQYTGRFTRTSSNVGDAKIVANIANMNFMNSLDSLYAEDADWNSMLSEFSSQAVKSHMRMIEFLRNCTAVDVGDETAYKLSPSVLLPKTSTVVFEAITFQPNNFYLPFSSSEKIKWAWISKDKQTTFFVTFQNPNVRWSKSRQVANREWNLYILAYDKSRRLLFIHSSDTSSLNREIAEAVSPGSTLIQGDQVFKTFGNVNRLTFQKVGLKRPGRRNISYSSFSGVDVGQALTEAQKSVATKSDIHGSGYEMGRPVNVGCSMKGRVWSRNYTGIDKFIDWCSVIGAKLQDPNIDTSKLLENTMIPVLIDKLPNSEFLKVDWPLEILLKKEDAIAIHGSTGDDLSSTEIRFIGPNADRTGYEFEVIVDKDSTRYLHSLGGPNKYGFTRLSGSDLKIEIGSKTRALEDYFFDYPPSVLFVDGSELDGCLLFQMKSRETISYPTADIVTWDWSDTDISKESKWKDGTQRLDSIQAKVIESFRKSSDILFDDDGSGEAADVISISEESDEIALHLFHCKFSSGSEPGSRIKDIIEVCAQAVKSNRWLWNFQRLCEHISLRERKSLSQKDRSRFETGTLGKLNKLKKASLFKPIRAKIHIVQPGLQKQAMTAPQTEILASTHTYLLETVNIPLSVICSS